MAVDPSDPDTFEEFDRTTQNTPNARNGENGGENDGENRANAAGDRNGTAARPAAGAPDEEVPEADAVEQRTEVTPQDDGPPAHIDSDTANEADALEQARIVGLDEDDYR
ncbi:hypothetical protein ABT354_07730 [Streptomyces sp. NPDC000594]|uniref:hypothetical protein n=1 Tax=Streptomyces sp. NPDC000594 TaxID=3154261 RepID=UPI0033187F95